MKKLTLLLLLWAVAGMGQPSGGVPPSPQKVVFASLGTPLAGNWRYCTDCTATSPCAGSGSGAFAFRAGGTWKCNVGAPSSTANQVNLQSSTPGTAQTGHLNISGTAIAGAFTGNLTGNVAGNSSTANGSTGNFTIGGNLLFAANGSIATDGATWTFADVPDGVSFILDLTSLGITPTTLTIPAAGGTLVTDVGTQTLTNKTIAASGAITPSETLGLIGTTTNNNVQPGAVGEFIAARCPGPATTATITVTIATPAVVTWSGHPFSGTVPRFDVCPVVFTTTGALPTGVTSGTNYWIVPTAISGNTFSIATSVSNAMDGIKVNTSGTQSGTQTGTAGTVLGTGATKDVTGLLLTAGDWDCSGATDFQFGSTTSVTNLVGSISTTSATLGGQDTGFDYETPASIPTATTDMTWPLPNVRQLLSGTTKVFSVAQATFTASTLKAYGTIRCRRMR